MTQPHQPSARDRLARMHQAVDQVLQSVGLTPDPLHALVAARQTTPNNAKARQTTPKRALNPQIAKRTHRHPPSSILHPPLRNPAPSPPTSSAPPASSSPANPPTPSPQPSPSTATPSPLGRRNPSFNSS